MHTCEGTGHHTFTTVLSLRTCREGELFALHSAFGGARSCRLAGAGERQHAGRDVRDLNYDLDRQH